MQNKFSFYNGPVDFARQYVQSSLYRTLESYTRNSCQVFVAGGRKYGGEISLDQLRGLADKRISLDREIAAVEEKSLSPYLYKPENYPLRYTGSLCGLYLLETSVCSIQRKKRGGSFVNSGSTRSLPLMEAFTGGSSQKFASETKNFLTQNSDEQVRTGKLRSIRLDKDTRGVPMLRQETVDVKTMEITPYFLLLESVLHLLNLLQISAARIRYSDGKNVSSYDVCLRRSFLYGYYGNNWKTALSRAWDGQSANIYLPVYHPDSFEVREFNIYRICEVIPLRPKK